MKTEKQVPAEVLRAFSPVNSLSLGLIGKLANETYFQILQVEEKMIAIEDEKPLSDHYFLVTGEVEVCAEGKEPYSLIGGSPESRTPVIPLTCKKATVTAKSPAIYFTVPGDKFESNEDRAQRKKQEKKRSDPQSIVEELVEQVTQALERDELVIPCLPDVALKVREAVADSRSDPNVVAKIIQADPAITARIIKCANSPVYRGQSGISECRLAVSRLGLKTTRDLVMSTVLRQMFQTDSKELEKLYRTVWANSVNLAATALVVSRYASHLEPDRALLAGLIYHIGALPIIAFVSKRPSVVKDLAVVEKLIQALSQKLGARILDEWNFDKEFVTVIKSAHNWSYQSGPKANYCDAVVMARYFNVISKEKPADLPSIEKVPAFHKFKFDELVKERPIDVLHNAREEIQEVISMLK